MLLDFTVANYRSIKEPVTLSAVAQKQRRVESGENSKRRRVKSDDEIASTVPLIDWNLEILPVVGIFGANASGKSNVVQALDYLLLLMQFGNSSALLLQNSKHTKLIPFTLSDSERNEPTIFKLRFAGYLSPGISAIYTYSLKLNQSQVFAETLDYELSSTKRSRCLFHRIWNHNIEDFEWKIGQAFIGSHLQLRHNLKNDYLFISVISSLKVEVIKPLLSWLELSYSRNLIYGEILDRGEILMNSVVRNQSEKPGQDDYFRRAVQIIKRFDSGIEEIEVKRGEDGYRIYAIHETANGSLVRWLFEEESLGTQRLLYLALAILITIDMASLIIVDEISANIHPNITKTLIRLFQKRKSNPLGAQLIFTSHDNTLQRNNLLRRDQIWFTQKRSDHSTELYPLTDFKVRNDLAIDKAYLDGRFGAVPILPAEDELLAGVEDE